MARKELLYQKIAAQLEQPIKSGVWRVGDRLPSLREICTDQAVSMNTAQQAYLLLESKGLIESRPQSGYYVSFAPGQLLSAPGTSSPQLAYGNEDAESLLQTVSANRAQVRIPFSSGVPSLELLPVAKLNKAMVQAIRSLPDSGINYDHRGNERLKRQIAKRSHSWGGHLKEDDIITTSGSMEAITFCMLSVTQPGDVIVVESPVYVGILQLARSLGLKVIELPTNASTGIELEALKRVLEKRKVKLCLLIPNFSNPLGSCMPETHKKEVVRLLQKHNVPLIEDDVYGDLHFSPQRPGTCKSYDESGLVMLCSSFSKTLASGYRVGWAAPGKFMEKVLRTKFYHSVATNTLAHEAIAYFLENDRYDAHLRKLRQTLQSNLLQYQRCISDYFPEDTKITRPQGGFILWVELNPKADVLALYNKAILNRISIGPGILYTLQKQYSNCFRLNYGLKWNDKLEGALKFLGRSL